MVSGLFIPLHFRSRERKVHRWNFHFRGTFVPWNIRSCGAKSPRTFGPWNFRTRGTFALQERMSKNFRSMVLSFPGTFAPILKKLGKALQQSVRRHILAMVSPSTRDDGETGMLTVHDGEQSGVSTVSCMPPLRAESFKAAAELFGRRLAEQPVWRSL